MGAEPREDPGSGVATADYAVTDEYGEMQPRGRVSVSADGTYCFIVPLQVSRVGVDLDGRTYTVTVSATNTAGTTASQSSTVIVAHDQRR